MQYQKITSAENAKIKLLKKLGQKKYRKEYGLFIVENFVIIRDALVSGYAYKEIFITDDFIKKQPEKIEFLSQKSQIKTAYLLDDKLNKFFSDLDCPAGIAAIYARASAKIDLSAPAVYLNGIKDPGNVGTIMRTALAFGYKNFIVDSACADIYNPKTINAAKDAIFKLNIIEDNDNSWLKARANDYQIIAADANQGQDIGKFRPRPKQKICLVLGSESHGLSREISALAQAKIKIQISPEIESLNVASAAAIILHAFSINN